MENYQTNINSKGNKLEYFIGAILAFSLWIYHLINAGIISHKIATECICFL